MAGEMNSQDNTDFTQLISWSLIKIHIIDSQLLNYLRQKALLFAETHLLLESNPL